MPPTLFRPCFKVLRGRYPEYHQYQRVGLAATSSDPSYATNNVQTVVVQGKTVTLARWDSNGTNGAAVDLFCACPGGKVGPFFFNPTSSTSISFTLPPSGPITGDRTRFLCGQQQRRREYSQKSNAVSVPIGAIVSLTLVTQRELRSRSTEPGSRP